MIEQTAGPRVHLQGAPASRPGSRGGCCATTCRDSAKRQHQRRHILVTVPQPSSPPAQRREKSPRVSTDAQKHTLLLRNCFPIPIFAFPGAVSSTLPPPPPPPPTDVRHRRSRAPLRRFRLCARVCASALGFSHKLLSSGSFRFVSFAADAPPRTVRCFGFGVGFFFCF